MKKKLTFYSEAAYLAGVILLAFGTALMAKADFGMSMVVAPAYVMYLKISQTLTWFTFGMAEYCLQAILIVILSLIVRKFKPMYLFSFVTAVFYGVILDLIMSVLTNVTLPGIPGRLAFFVIGLLFCALGVAFFFHTYIAPEAYELLVKEISSEFHADITRVKTIYDAISCVTAILLSFLFFGLWHFEGVKAGTALLVFINGWLIGRMSDWLSSTFEFQDGLRLRRYFE